MKNHTRMFNTSYKFWLVCKPLHIGFNKAHRFIRVYDGKGSNQLPKNNDGK